MRTSKTIYLVLFLIIFIGFEGFLLLKKSPLTSNQVESFSSLAQKIVDKCSTSDYKAGCYETEVPKLMATLSMENTFAVTKDIQHIDTSYQYCHVLGHKLSAEETKKNPDEWKTVITRCPSGVCSNGCIHGAFQERFRTESLPDAKIEELRPQLDDVCEARGNWNPTGMEQGSCYHALGHLAMYITDANIQKSVELCDAVAKKKDRDWSQLCYDGAFMQIFQPLEPDDFALIKGKEIKSDSEHVSLCNQFSGRAKGSCWSEGWPLYFEKLKTGEGLSNYCTQYKQNSVETERCFNSLFYVMTAQMNFDVEKISSYCSEVKINFRGNCFANAASRMIETDWENVDLSLRLCENAKNFGAGDRCYQELALYANYNFHPDSPESKSLCNKLPEEFIKECSLDRKN
jgi:hypothetical protein